MATLRLSCVALFLLASSTATSAKYRIPQEAREKENEFWYSMMREDIDFASNRAKIEGQAKNVIIFLGDGMGLAVNTAARIYKGQRKHHSGEEETLVWEKFPNVALSKPYTLDRQVADSASSATAYLCGVKANYFTVGVNGKVRQGDCKASLVKGNRVDSILKWSQDAGKDTGIVTNTRITHATPSALYAHSADRNWECDAKLKKSQNDTTGCKDIAMQLIEDSPGRNINVLFGGGRRQLGAPLPGDTDTSCLRNDSRNLVEEWLKAKQDAGHSASYVSNNQELRKLNLHKTDFILGLFSGTHMPYEFERDEGPEGTPSLKEMTEVAIKRLQRNPKGFFLLVEGGRIDHALHDTRPHPALHETLALEAAVEVALKLINNEDTLVIVTADHSHVMTINGYPERGNDILGITTYSDVTDNLPYTTLMFTTGNATNYTIVGDKVMRSNLTGVDTRDFHFMPQAVVPTLFGSETHGGEDVAIFATGPQAHLFHRVHEQPYISHVMAYASCVGPYTYDCNKIAGKHQYFTKSQQIPSSGGGQITSSFLLWGSLLLSPLLKFVS